VQRYGSMTSCKPRRAARSRGLAAPRAHTRHLRRPAHDERRQSAAVQPLYQRLAHDDLG
jgi:hypothetical protein